MRGKIIGLTALGAIVTLMGTAYAEPIKYYPPNALQQLCRSNNGTYLPPTKDSPVYTCFKQGGGIIVCGGIGKWAKTCDGSTFLKRRDIRKRLKGRQ